MERNKGQSCEKNECFRIALALSRVEVALKGQIGQNITINYLSVLIKQELRKKLKTVFEFALLQTKTPRSKRRRPKLINTSCSCRH